MPEEKPLWERTYDRRGFVAISAMTAFLAACGGNGDDGEPSAGGQTAAEEKLGGTLFYWSCSS